MEFKLKALTPMWTGGVERNDNSILHLTGIKGSIRWWYEVLIRGLAGYACDPSEDNKRCTLELKKLKELKKEGKTEEEALNSLICPACQMFGCTNWGSKFILRIDDNSGSVITSMVKRVDPCTLKFIEKKVFTPYEKKLLHATIKLIVEYGAIGGKTGLKPSEVPYKNCESYRKHNHVDYGLLDYQNEPIASSKPNKFIFKLKINETDWPNLSNFWFVKGAYVSRIEHNNLANRNTKFYDNNASEFQVFLGGYIKDKKDNNGKATRNIPDSLQTVVEKRNLRSDGESKKIFSFHGLTHCDKTPNCVKQDFPPRCFGYGRNAKERDNSKNAIERILNGKSIRYETKTGQEVLDEL
ncbi:MAG: type III-B CRISPR module RAMP protein Cmr1 [Candidatus Brocadia sp. AMX2]|uniref:CRISPR-associated RAMP protein Cmr1 family n=1 Tax=Candidatus Brocadia sinica JPN1 TaxID=1197129 RepID=A0ABQ0JSR9_9BACT|nr:MULTISPECIES: type III-B CRISPR module RAMP protein Cmr1 [Brocadia]MBC6933658.1 type III-B CRISPR module RAMP protein Cmr1 [Candidatus Brocadia sp.]MBL1170506.1 type III-B CRISPR module RAMP protein Cmr1 [Candidatus Brocadia sp. AMX1]NOG43345.1 type III-B CRISPR module RAMP protein Cmr1 [Planctomycetota bacterium]NUO05237.1 type III-B CRISPR module RAMP protein Cmr1 [Candidatus Brocadia sinica]KAA0243317.1 MAG: type III-B CRISPR module RAMP protein Cmr1 [Candidatus Brocadia sp. AMX2]